MPTGTPGCAADSSGPSARLPLTRLWIACGRIWTRARWIPAMASIHAAMIRATGSLGLPLAAPQLKPLARVPADPGGGLIARAAGWLRCFRRPVGVLLAAALPAAQGVLLLPVGSFVIAGRFDEPEAAAVSAPVMSCRSDGLPHQKRDRDGWIPTRSAMDSAENLLHNVIKLLSIHPLPFSPRARSSPVDRCWQACGQILGFDDVCPRFCPQPLTCPISPCPLSSLSSI